MSAKGISPFQMTECKVIDFSFTSSGPGLVAHGVTSQKIELTSIEQTPGNPEEHKGALRLSLTISIGDANEGVTIKYTQDAVFLANKNAMDADQFFDYMLVNGVSGQLAMARGHLAAATALLGLSPGYQLPFINVYDIIEANNLYLHNSE